MSDQLIRQIQTAIKAKCPITAVSVPGRAPWRGRTELLRLSLKGLKIVDAQFQTEPNQQTSLRVEGIGPGVTAVRLYRPIPYVEAWRIISDWSERERKRRKGPNPDPIRKGLKGHYSELKKLTKQLERINTKPPVHGLLTDLKRSRPVSEDQREGWGRWKAEAAIRRELWQMARLVRDGKQDTRWLYAEARGRFGLNPRKYSEVTERERQRYKLRHIQDYLRQFWEFCRLTPKPWGYEPNTYSEFDDYAELGPKHYKNWLAQVRAKNELESRIQAVREIIKERMELRGEDQV